MKNFSKNFISLLTLLLSLNLYAQFEITPELFEGGYINTGSNQTVGFSSVLDDFAGGQLRAFVDLNGDGEIGYHEHNYSDGSSVVRPECVGATEILTGFWSCSLG